MAPTRKSTKKKLKKQQVSKSSEISFSSEALLQQALARLFNRMPGITGVQILQGAQELGKDLVFYFQGPLGEPMFCACVVKNKKITGAAEGNSGARTIYNQADQAFDTPYTDSFGRELKVERVYVVTPYDLSPPTISSIEGKLKKRPGQIQFIGGSILFDLFKKYWPDFLADEAEILEQHLSETKQLYGTQNPIEELASLFNIGDVSQYPRKVYVNQNLYRDIYDYEAGASLTAPLPPLDNIAKNFRRKEIEYIQDKLNYLRRAVTFLVEWGYCNEREKEVIYSTSNTVMNSIANARRKHEHKLKQEQLLREKGEELKSLEDKKDKKDKRDYQNEKRELQQTIESILKAIAKLDAEKNAELTAAQSGMKSLGRTRRTVISKIDSNLSTLKRTLLNRKPDPLVALSDPAYLQAYVLADCVNAAPEGMFSSRKVSRLLFPRDILDKWGGHILIVGAPGYGKTSFCRWHALQDAENYSTGNSTIIPSYVPLHKLAGKSLGSFKEVFLKNLGKSALLKQIDDSSNLRVRLYLDGLDEIASVERRRQVVELAMSGDSSGRKYQVILTSRDYIYAKWLDCLPRITLGGFEEEDINELVNRWLGYNSDDNKRFRNQIEALPALHNLMHTPLLATLIIMVFRQTGKLPENKTKLYDNFVDLLSGGWDLLKGVLRQSKYGQWLKVQVLTTLAGTLQEQRLRAFHGQDVEAAIKTTLSASIAMEWESVLEEFIVDGLVTKSGNVLQFAHHSFQEFLAAKYYMGNPQPLRVNRAVEAYLSGDDWWKEVIKFYIGLSTSPRDVSDWLEGRISHLRTISYLTISPSQVESIRSAMLEAFPEYSGEALKEIKNIV